MEVLGSALLSTLLALVSTLLVLSLLVQVVQEIYKHLTSSKARSYTKVLVDTLGPWAQRMRQPDALPDLQVRGPFQFLRLRPRGILLPLAKAELVEGLERTTPPWYQRTLQAIRLEATLQEGQEKGQKIAPSHAWNSFLAPLASTGKGAPGYWSAKQVARFLGDWDHGLEEAEDGSSSVTPPDSIDARAMLEAFRENVIPHVTAADRNYPQIMRNVDYAYRRRNLRQTFIIALILALLANFSFERLWQQASSMSTEEAVELAERSLQLAESEACRGAECLSSQDIERAGELLQAALTAASDEQTTLQYLDVGALSAAWSGGPIAILRYLFGCLITAVAISFGAPFWNDLVKSLLRLQQGRKASVPTE